jgi:hypothetical protein
MNAIGITDTLDERKNTHGDFSENAHVTMNILKLASDSSSWKSMTLTQQLAVIMISNKLARILTGNPYEPDHWHDIAGYATLSERDTRARVKKGAGG